MHDKTLIEYWNGRQWRVVRGAPLPVDGVVGGSSKLVTVAATSASDVWAGGDYGVDGLPPIGDEPLIEHWNGRTWQLVALPKLPYNAQILGLSARTTRDAWAVGAAFGSTKDGKNILIALHWDGRSWRNVTSSAFYVNYTVQLSSVAALSAHDVWAVGDSGNGGLIVHWDGRRWTRVAAPQGGDDNAYGAVLDIVVALSPRDIWAIGELVAHWNGRRWTRVLNGYLYHGWTALTAAGHTVMLFTFGYEATWDGRHWSSTSTTNDSNALFSGAGALSAHDVWAVGHIATVVGSGPSGHSVEAPLIIHGDGWSWRVVPNGLP